MVVVVVLLLLLVVVVVAVLLGQSLPLIERFALLKASSTYCLIQP